MTNAADDPRARFAREIVERLRGAGYVALWAGGCVRDRLLDRVPKDYDVASSATPDQVRQVFGVRKTLAIGAAFGVIAVVGNKSQGTVEVATFRRDTNYSDGRRPDAVEFSSPEEDAQRRDFTINGLFYDPLDERVIDYVGGVDDLHRGIVRAIGDPRERFAEDRLRLLRAIRMTARFDFALDDATRAAVEVAAATVVSVSPERIGQEMRQMLTIASAPRAMTLLLETGLLQAVWPEVLSLATQAAAIDDLPPWPFALAVLAQTDHPTVPLALAAMTYQLDSPHTALDGANQRWRLANKEHERSVWLAEHARALVDAPQARWSLVQPLLIHDGADELIALHAAIAQVAQLDSAHVAFCRARRALPSDALNPAPLVTGRDLLAAGYTAGPEFAGWLSRLRAAQLDGEIESREGALALVQAWMQQREHS